MIDNIAAVYHRHPSPVWRVAQRGQLACRYRHIEAANTAAGRGALAFVTAAVQVADFLDKCSRLGCLPERIHLSACDEHVDNWLLLLLATAATVYKCPLSRHSHLSQVALVYFSHYKYYRTIWR